MKALSLPRDVRSTPVLTFRKKRLPYRQVNMILVILVTLCALQVSAAPPDAEVLPPGVSVRQGPAPTTPIVAELQAGAQVEVVFTQRGPEGNWVQVVLPSGRAGFVPEQALRRLISAPQWKSTGHASSGRSITRQMGEGVLDIPLRRAGGVFLVTARINNQITTNFIVDTGATAVMISEALADQLGVEYANKPKQRTLTASGFLERPRIVLDSIHVPDEGGAGVAGVEAYVASLPGAPPAIGGLLGQSFLRHFHVTIDAERAVMHLRSMRQ
jgi:clan AA aspartic protease (TIGR02281 family)